MKVRLQDGWLKEDIREPNPPAVRKAVRALLGPPLPIEALEPPKVAKNKQKTKAEKRGIHVWMTRCCFWWCFVALRDMRYPGTSRQLPQIAQVPSTAHICVCRRIPTQRQWPRAKGQRQRRGPGSRRRSRRRRPAATKRCCRHCPEKPSAQSGNCRRCREAPLRNSAETPLYWSSESIRIE